MILGSVLHGILAFFFSVAAILLIIVILLQRGKGVGLSGAFGGTGGHSAFGTKTGDFLTWVTVVGAAVLLIFAVMLNFVFQPAPPEILTEQQPATPASPETPAQPGGGGTPPAGENPAPWPATPELWSIAQPLPGYLPANPREFPQDRA